MNESSSFSIERAIERAAKRVPVSIVWKTQSGERRMRVVKLKGHYPENSVKE